MANRYKRPALIATGVLLSAAAVGYFLYHLRGHWGEVGRSLARADYLYLIPSVGLIALMYGLRVLRWRVFLKPIGAVPYQAIASATCIGFMSSCILPLRPGELIRPYVLHRKSGIPFGYAAGTAIGLERAFDLIGVCFLLLLTWSLMTTYVGQPGPLPAAAGASVPVSHLQDVWKYGIVFVAITVVGLVCLLALALFPSFLLRVAEFFLRGLPASWHLWLTGFLRSLAQSMAFLKNPGQVATGVLLSLAIWLLVSLSTYSLALGLGLNLPLVGALLVQLILTGAVAAPQAPSFLGVFQVAAMTGAELFGIPKGDAAAFAMVLWAVNVIPITAVGLGFLWYEGFGLRRLASMSREAAGQDAPEATDAEV